MSGQLTVGVPAAPPCKPACMDATMIPRTIASAHDLRRIEASPYARFMAHDRVLAALEATAMLHPQRTALCAIDVPDPGVPMRHWTFAAFVAEVRRAARLFRALVEDGTPRVALLLPPVPEAHFALWGAEAVGIACPINFQLNAEHVAAQVRACRAQVVVALGPASDLDIWPHVSGLQQQCPALRHVLAVRADQALPEGVRDFAAEVERHDGGPLASCTPATPLAALFHTGGTTGAPKLAQHTQGNQLHAAWGAAQMFGTTEHDVMLNGFPLFHVAGAFVYGLSTLLAGGQVVLPTRLALRNTALMARFGDFVERHGVTLLAAVPTVIAALLALPLRTEQLASVRALLTGGSPLPDELAAAFEQRHGIPVRNILGMTESAGVISIEPCAAPRVPGSCGWPLPFMQVQVQRADGTPAAPGESGILRVRGPNVSPGYTDRARDAGTFDDGWLVSGDIAHLDDQGRIFVTGRAKDVIIRGAHNIDPGLIENALLRHPAVQMAAAVGEPDVYAGELPVAFVSLKPGMQVAPVELSDFVAPYIAERPAVPKRIDILPSLPTTAVGKVYKPALRVLATQRALQAQLQQAGLAERARVQVSEAPSGLVVCFELFDGAAESAVRALMQPFALAYDVKDAA